MSSIQRTHFVLIRQILRQLRTFGLNPYDWQIERNTSAAPTLQAGIFDIRHRLDENFKMRAQFESNARGYARLQALKVVSL